AGFVAREGALLDGQVAAAADAAAQGDADEGIIVADSTAVAAFGLVVAKRAAADVDDTARIVDAAASSDPSAIAADRLVAGRGALRYAEDATGPGELFSDAPTASAPPAEAADGLVVGEPGAADGSDRTEFIVERTSNPGEKGGTADSSVVVQRAVGDGEDRAK